MLTESEKKQILDIEDHVFYQKKEPIVALLAIINRLVAEAQADIAESAKILTSHIPGIPHRSVTVTYMGDALAQLDTFGDTMAKA